MNSNSVSSNMNWAVGIGSFLAFFLARGGMVEAGVDFSNPSPVNLTVAIVVGLLLGLFAYYICFLIRTMTFARMVRQETGPKAAYESSWGKVPRVFSGIISFIIALGIAYMVFWLLGG